MKGQHLEWIQNAEDRPHVQSLSATLRGQAEDKWSSEREIEKERKPEKIEKKGVCLCDRMKKK